MLLLLLVACQYSLHNNIVIMCVMYKHTRNTARCRHMVHYICTVMCTVHLMHVICTGACSHSCIRSVHFRSMQWTPLLVRLRATLARSALTRVSLARFTSATSILTRFQFGAFLFGALPLRRVSLWRASTSARFSLARFPILYLSWCILGYLIICFLSARVFFEEVLSTPVLREATLLGLLSRITFCLFLLYASYIY